MKVTNSGQVAPDEVINGDVHVVLCASGYESRSTNLAKTVHPRDQAILHAWPFKDRRVLSRKENDLFFEEAKYELCPAMDGEDFGAAFHKLQDTLRKAKERFGDTLKIAIDYSCMTRAWYGGIVRALFCDAVRFRELEVYFCYSPAQFTPPSKVVINTLAGPLTGFSNLWPVDRPVALILGLGYEGVRAAGLREYLDPARTVAFYTDPALDDRFTAAVLENNGSLLQSLEPGHVIRHPLADLDRTAALLHDITSELAKQFRVITAPLGVKPFALLSMLLAARYGDIDVWRVSGGRLGAPTQRNAIGSILPYKVTFAE